MTVVVNNLPTTVREFIVARECDGELWFWGSWDKESDAREVAYEIGGVVVRR